MAYNSEIKTQIVNQCKKAGINTPGFMQTVLRVERGVMDLRGKIEAGRASYHNIAGFTQWAKTEIDINSLNGSIPYLGEPKYMDDYKKYCQVNGLDFTASLGDKILN